MVKPAFRQGASFGKKASFGKRIEFWIIAEMIRYGLDVYVPLVDDMGIDAVVRKSDGAFVEVQIKARSVNAKIGTEAQFDVTFVPGRKLELRKNYWFVFYSERLDKMWIMASEEFVRESRQVMSGKNEGRRFINFKGNPPKFQEYAVPDGDFSRIKGAYRAVLPKDSTPPT